MKKGKAVVILVFILACVGFFGWYGTTIDVYKRQRLYRKERSRKGSRKCK